MKYFLLQNSQSPDNVPRLFVVLQLACFDRDLEIVRAAVMNPELKIQFKFDDIRKASEAGFDAVIK